MAKTIKEAVEELNRSQTAKHTAVPLASKSGTTQPITVTANVSHTNPLYPNEFTPGPSTTQTGTGQTASGNKYNYDPSSNAGYQDALSAIQILQQNKPASSYDPISDEAYQQALAALQQAQANMPSYAGTYDAQMQNLYNSIVNRDKFSYDLNSDMLYQQYRDQYKMMGQQAMMDTMGQAASLTGGYGSSYAQQVGQQSYNNYLNQLNNVVPDLYGMALDQYNAEGQNLLNQYSMLGELRDNEYSQYQDSLTDHWNNIQYLADRANTAYNQGYAAWSDANANYWNNLEHQTNRADTEWGRGYDDWYNSIQMQIAEDDRNYQREQDEKNWQQMQDQIAKEDQRYEDELAYSREQDEKNWQMVQDQTAYDREQDAKEWQQNSYSNLRNAIINSGYKPTTEELASAGMTASEAEYWLGVYNYSREQDAKEDERYKDELAWEREQIEIDRETEANKTAYDRQQDAYSNLVTAIATTGYTPTAEELTAAGMSQAEAEAWLNYFNLQNGTSYSYGSSSSGGGYGGGSYSGSSGGSSSSGSSSGGSSGGSYTIPIMASDQYVDSVIDNIIIEAAKPTTGVYGMTIGGTPSIQGVDIDYMKSQGSSGSSSNKTSSTNSSSSSSTKQTQAGSTSNTTNAKSNLLSSSKVSATISAYKNQIKSQYGSNISTSKMNAYLKNKILYSGYSSDQKTQLLRYAGLM